MTDIQWTRVGNDLFVVDPAEIDGMRHPAEGELDLLIALWDMARQSPDPEAAARAGLHTFMQNGNRRTWLELEALKNGTDNQRERYLGNVLPYEELLALARAELFKLFTAKRWRPLSYAIVTHKTACADRIDITSSLVYSTDPQAVATANTDLDHDTWEQYRHILRTCEFLRTDHQWLIGLPPLASVRSNVYRHRAVCTGCKAEVTKLSVRVVIPWAGHNLTREYAL